MDLGAYRYKSENLGRVLSPVGTDHIWVATLTYAEVNGVTYGSESIATAVEPPRVVDAESPRRATVYPNPFRQEVHFEVEGLQEEPVRAEMFDVMGWRVLARQVELGRGTTTLRMNSGPSGVYLLRVTDVAGRQVGKLLVRVPSEVE